MTTGELLDRFPGMHVLVIGDLMLDEYIVGKATRISPEAPVMVVHQQRTFAVPGGAANVAKNIEALGGRATVFGVVGDDPAGAELRSALGGGAVVISDPNRPTTRKTRVLADTSHQVLRIDHESDSKLTSEIESQLIAAVSLRVAEADAVLLSDYTKGVLNQELVSEVIRLAHQKGIPVVANAKPTSLPLYRGANLVSLNAKEAAEAIANKDALQEYGPIQVAKELASDYGIQHVLITLGDKGMATDEFTIDPQKVEVFDTAGAGDTTIATISLGMAAVGFDKAVFDLAAHTSAAVVRHVGVAVPSDEDIQRIRDLQ